MRMREKKKETKEQEEQFRRKKWFGWVENLRWLDTHAHIAHRDHGMYGYAFKA